MVKDAEKVVRAVFWSEPTGSRHCDGSNSDDKSNLEQHALSLSAQVCKQRNVLDIWQFWQSLMVSFCFQPFPTSQKQTKEPLFNPIEPFSYLKPNQFISVSLIFKKMFLHKQEAVFSLVSLVSYHVFFSHEPHGPLPPSGNPRPLILSTIDFFPSEDQKASLCYPLFILYPGVT